MILAGGGKRRALPFIANGLTCWLNGSLMLNPRAAGKVNSAFLEGDGDTVEKYINTVERPYFDDFISKVGWHVGHKAALHIAGFCQLAERRPMPVLGSAEVSEFRPIVDQVLNGLSEFE